MSRRFWKWMAEAWFSYLIWGTMLAIVFGSLGITMKFKPVASVLLAITGYGLCIGLRAIQYVGYDFSAPDND